jgi:hypothetical protein
MLNNRSIDGFSQKPNLLVESEYIHTPPPSFFFGEGGMLGELVYQKFPLPPKLQTRSGLYM